MVTEVLAIVKPGLVLSGPRATQPWLSTNVSYYKNSDVRHNNFEYLLSTGA